LKESIGAKGTLIFKPGYIWRARGRKGRKKGVPSYLGKKGKEGKKRYTWKKGVPSYLKTVREERGKKVVQKHSGEKKRERGGALSTS